MEFDSNEKELMIDSFYAVSSDCYPMKGIKLEYLERIKATKLSSQWL